MFKRLFSAALIFGAAALAPPVVAQANRCMPRDALIATLKQTYSETLKGGGLQSSQHLLEIWTSTQTGSFTVFVTQANGIACVIASGQSWNSVMPPPPPDIAG